MIIIYGGSFNPPTKAHKTIKDYLMKKYSPSLFIFLPVGNKYPKSGLVSYEHRKAMLKLISEETSVVVSDFEQTETFTGTVSALDHFSKLYNEEVFFVLGADNLKNIGTWIENDRLISTYRFIAIDRDHQIKDMIKDLNLPLERFSIENLDLKEKSSRFRENPKENTQELDESVLNYIKKHHLYEV
ncbi:nicotinate-nucleotide adenylyltransferase [Acholeplasma morum]|uniref:nicotinate-nicotinamide nucleotide adenylyltransferase n=1 Tax=Paracholeplasma morum TaxID=264637 RepID=UPI00195DB87E|nr:nicotinate-nicotinamide nucleotide adenylyltransferase [Paracholeplasma morum]MBM7452753.1 nicotinate-nucleotide adenylyltransferase [Paracholeplasma morum]